MAVKLALAGFLIPYIFCYNPALLMIGASNAEIIFIVCTASVGIASLSFASVGYWLRDLYFWELSAACGCRHYADHPWAGDRYNWARINGRCLCDAKNDKGRSSGSSEGSQPRMIRCSFAS